jgi:hypothetical protein
MVYISEADRCAPRDLSSKAGKAAAGKSGRPRETSAAKAAKPRWSCENEGCEYTCLEISTVHSLAAKENHKASCKHVIRKAQANAGFASLFKLH